MLLLNFLMILKINYEEFTMKGLSSVPSLKSLQFAYDKLLKNSFSAKDLALWTQWSRLDPRLAEILVSNFSKNWKKISPIELNIEILKQPWSAALGVLLC